MTEHKFIDDEIIKGLEEELKTALVINHRFEESNDTENPEDHKFIALLSDTIKLINRQKAEIKRLEKQNAEMLISETAEFHIPMEIAFRARTAHPIFREIKSEAIKEFAERLKEIMQDCARMDFGGHTYFIIGIQPVDNLVKEMTEETEVSPHEICVVCGDQVPEGRQVCHKCETGQEFLNKRKE